MKNLILRQGDFVRALIDVIGPQGTLQCGQTYRVETLQGGALGVNALTGYVELVDSTGLLTDACDAVRRVARADDSALPQGARTIDLQRPIDDAAY